MSQYYAEFEREMDAIAAAMREEYANRARRQAQALNLDNVNPLARCLYRADAWLQRVTEIVLASFA